MMMLTHFGSPKPWTTEEVQLELMRVRQELDGKTPHSYTNLRRVWAQKPLDATD